MIAATSDLPVRRGPRLGSSRFQVGREHDLGRQFVQPLLALLFGQLGREQMLLRLERGKPLVKKFHRARRSSPPASGRNARASVDFWLSLPSRCTGSPTTNRSMRSSRASRRKYSASADRSAARVVLVGRGDSHLQIGQRPRRSARCQNRCRQSAGSSLVVSHAKNFSPLVVQHPLEHAGCDQTLQHLGLHEGTKPVVAR